MYRTSYHSLQNYNATPRGTVQGPPVFPQIPKMNNETPLYPKINHGYNALVYDGTGSPYYRINSGPYGAFEKGKCSGNWYRKCTGGKRGAPVTPRGFPGSASNQVGKIQQQGSGARSEACAPDGTPCSSIDDYCCGTCAGLGIFCFCA